MNPHYDPSLYQAYSEQTRLNLVYSSLPVSCGIVVWLTCFILSFLVWLCLVQRKLNEDVIDYDLLEDLVCHIDENCGDGAVLVFLPVRVVYTFLLTIECNSVCWLLIESIAETTIQGVSEIYRLHDKLAASYRFGGESSEWLLPLHSSVAAADQKKVFLNPPQNTRKVCVSSKLKSQSALITRFEGSVIFIILFMFLFFFLDK